MRSYQGICCFYDTRLTEEKCPLTERLEGKSVDEKKRIGKKGLSSKEPGYGLMLSEAALSEWWPVSLCQHNKSRDTWHLELHQDELIGGST